MFTLDCVLGTLSSFCSWFDVYSFQLSFETSYLLHVAFAQVLEACAINLSDSQLFNLFLVFASELIERLLGL